MQMVSTMKKGSWKILGKDEPFSEPFFECEWKSCGGKNTIYRSSVKYAQKQIPKIQLTKKTNFNLNFFH